MTQSNVRQTEMPKGILTTLLALYLAQGLPSGLFAHALPVFWREAGVSLTWIGALKLLALPWVLKAFWAPFIDRSLMNGKTPFSWILRLQLTAALLLIILAWLGLVPGSASALVAAALLVMTINLLIATQDIVTDGLAVRWIAPHWRGLANTIQVAGYKVGMLAGGSLLLIVAGYLEPETALLLPALLLVALLFVVGRSRGVRKPLLLDVATDSGNGSFGAAFVGLWRQPGMAFWLLMVIGYKVADAMGSGMIRPMLSDAGWSSQAIGTFTLITTLVGLIGAALGGWLYTLIGGHRALILTGIAQALAIMAWVLATGPATAVSTVYAVGLAEQLADGASTVVLFAMMMNVCRSQWAGTDFTVQASIQVVAAGLFGVLGGLIADLAGYAVLMITAGLAGLGVVGVYAHRIIGRSI
ncbi:MFS transporter [Marinobacter sp. DUT-1]|uniref:MFS transporter n=1 Tax=Marinobacter sp. DUT-1 TaxID=3412037 RepID=UPI003D1790A3